MLAPKQTSRTLKRNKMKIRQFLFAACTALVLTACSKDTIDNGHANAVEIDNITITEEPFEPETPAKSSAKQTRAVQAPQIVDLGDGLIAEVSLTEDAHEETPARTRAAIADGHYTIYATKLIGGPGTSGPILAKLSGTVQGGKFVRDASSPRMRLDPDTYTFVCVNDAMSKEIHSYHGDIFALRNDKDNPMIATVTMPISGNIVEIPFVMKHSRTSRVRFQITSYTNEGHNITGKLAFSSIMTTVYFDMAGRMFGGFGTTFTSGTYTFAESPVTPSAYTQIIKRTTDYRYFISDAPGASAQFTIDGGSIYGKSLAGKSFPLTAIANLQENKSYTCNIKLKPAVLYLFQDGTVGVLADKGTRTPIGIVVKEKTTTEKGLAIALKDAGQGLSWGPDNVKANDVQIPMRIGGNMNPTYVNDMNGYHYTWESSGSNDGTTIKGNVSTFPVFTAAAQYNPGVSVTGSNVGKWFLPSAGEFRLFFVNVWKYEWPLTDQYCNSGVKYDIYFTQAGGTALSRDYATSTETTNLTQGTQIWNFSNSAALSDYFERTRPLTDQWHVRSFVHF